MQPDHTVEYCVMSRGDSRPRLITRDLDLAKSMAKFLNLRNPKSNKVIPAPIPTEGWQQTVTPTIADNYHGSLYRVGRPCRWVGAVDAVGRPVAGQGEWVSDVVKEVGYAA